MWLGSYGPAALLTIRVGTGSIQQDFVAHESFLISRSGFFRRAVNGRWEESETRIVKLPEDSPKIFALYIDCAYTNQISSDSVERNPPAKAENNTKENIDLLKAEIWDLVHVYILAEKLLDGTTKNIVIETLFKLFHLTNPCLRPSECMIKEVYRNTPETSPLRRFLVDLRLDYASAKLRKEIDGLPKEYLLDLAIALQARATGINEVAKQNGVGVYLQVAAQEREEGA